MSTTKTWLQAGEARAQDARDEQAIDAAEDEREYPFYDQDLADRAQNRYERTVLGWGCD
ncbi:hypothetical protein [Pseudonocardia sp. 73-21]|uniref:hypothetical protein n=1 Tax=Pseudonocardia sp. 73-21 TaxID=1895809 RepID=UPI0026285C37|nr:hypothetical protein [Pseudonocardia sp. 73-21]